MNAKRNEVARSFVTPRCGREGRWVVVRGSAPRSASGRITTSRPTTFGECEASRALTHTHPPPESKVDVRSAAVAAAAGDGSPRPHGPHTHIHTQLRACVYADSSARGGGGGGSSWKGMQRARRKSAKINECARRRRKNKKKRERERRRRSSSWSWRWSRALSGPARTPPRGHPRAAAESGGRNERASCFNFSSPSPSSSSRPVFAASFSIYVNEWASDAFATTRNVYTRLHPIHDRRHPPPRQPFAMKRNKIMRTHMVEWNKHGARGIADLLLNLSSKNLKF